MMVTTPMHLSIDRHIVRRRARRIALVLVVGLLHCAGVARAEMLTIYVDGIDFTRSAVRSEALLGPAPDRPTSYLQNSWLGSALAKEVGGLQRSIPWNGDLSDTTNINTAIRTLELELINGAKAGHRINLVTHSMGTVIGYLALLDLAIKTKKETSAYQGVENFVTLASPLAHGTHLKVIRGFGQNSVFMIPSSESGLRTAAEIRIRNRWINVYADGDVIGGSLGVSDVRSSALPAVAGVSSHSQPYLHYETIRALIAQFAGAAVTTSQTASAPAQTESSVAQPRTVLPEPPTRPPPVASPISSTMTEGGRAVVALLRDSTGAARNMILTSLLNARRVASGLTVDDVNAIIAGMEDQRGRSISQLGTLIVPDLSAADVVSLSGQTTGVARNMILTSLLNARRVADGLSVDDVNAIMSGMEDQRSRSISQLGHLIVPNLSAADVVSLSGQTTSRTRNMILTSLLNARRVAEGLSVDDVNLIIVGMEDQRARTISQLSGHMARE